MIGLISLIAPCGHAFAQTTSSEQASTPDRGWNGLATVLDALTPSASTDEPPTGEQINSNIEQLLNEGRSEAAFRAIERREKELAGRPGPGTDVQLMFQKARALAQLNRTAEAQAIYQQMTIRYPELSEPWNNLAILYIARNDLDQARLALENAIMNNPKSVAAISNLADLRLLMALRGYEQAAKLGSRLAQKRATLINKLLQEMNKP